jgi:O-antigen ligase
MRMISSAAATASALARVDWAHRALAVGWWLFIAAFFVAPDKHALRTTFYVLVALPAVIWARVLIREIDWRDPLWLAISATLLYLSSSALWGADAGEPHAMRAFKIMFILAIAFVVPRCLSRAGLFSVRHLTGAIIVLATIVAASNLLMNLSSIWSGDQPFNPYMRMAGWGQFENPLQYGGIIGCSALLALSAFFRASRRSRQIGLLAVLGLLALSLALTMSRGPIIYFCAASVLIAVVYRAYWRRTVLLLLLATAIALPLLFHPAIEAVIEATASRTSHRPAIWSSVMAEMPGKELFGQGWRDDQSVYTPEGRFGHPHNFLLGIYRFGGLVGLALFIAMTGLLLYRCARLRRDIAVPLGAWFLYGILLHLTNGRFHVSAPGNDWFFYWLPATLIYAVDRTIGGGQREEKHTS